MSGTKSSAGRWKRIGIRDGWVCWLCEKAVDAAIIAPDPLSPSVDHVIPLAAGGSDAEDNVRLAHFGCNSRRGAMVAA